MAKDLMITTKELIETAKKCVAAVSIEECRNCPLGEMTECQNFMIKELADRLELREHRTEI